jgi:hypothetical protein
MTRNAFAIVVSATLFAGLTAGCATAEVAPPKISKAIPKKAKKAEAMSDKEIEAGVAKASADASVFGGPTWVDRRPRNGETRHRPRFVFPFEVNDLPIEVTAASTSTPSVPLGKDGEPAPEIVIKKQPYDYYGYGYGQNQTYNTVSVEGEGFTSGTIRIGPSEGVFSVVDGNRYGGVSVACSPSDYVVAAHWEGLSLTRAAKSRRPTSRSTAGSDRKTCKAGRPSEPASRSPDRRGTVGSPVQRRRLHREDAGRPHLPRCNQRRHRHGPAQRASSSPGARALPVKKGTAESVMASVPRRALPAAHGLRRDRPAR